VTENFISDQQVEILLSDLIDHYGYDFTEYSKASMKRRVNRLFTMDQFLSFDHFRHRIKNDPAYLKRFVEEITVNVTEMFRDPWFFKTIRKEILPILATYPLIRIWHAGCSTGEEVYSMAIMLQEANLLHKSILYATDLNPDVLHKASLGIFPLSAMKEYSINYIEAGGENEFSSYYYARYDRVLFKKELANKMVFATHNLVSDRSFNEFQLILCRNVMIYFDRELQERVLQLFDNSLDSLGFVALGSKETLRFSGIAGKYKLFNDKGKIWRKKE
jgi:chemotaxis protein methyltransferase CheR